MSRAALPPPGNSDGLRTAEACGDCDRGSRGSGGGVCIDDGEFSRWEFEDEDVGLDGLIREVEEQMSLLASGRICGGVLRGTLLTKGGDDMPKGFHLDGVVDEVRGFMPCGDLIGEGVVEGVIGVMVGVEGVIGLITGGVCCSVGSRKSPRVGEQFEGGAVFAVVVLLLMLPVLVVVSAGFLKTGQVYTSTYHETYVVAALIQLDVLQRRLNFVMLWKARIVYNKTKTEIQ
ncbi:hypothetical protein Tco_0143416 [Tanacetum coccineum]